MFGCLEVLPPEPVEHPAPELRIAADDVVHVRSELAAVAVNPVFAGAIAELLPDGRRIPVLVFAWHGLAALDDQNAGAGIGQRMRDGAPAGAAADDDDVEL